MRDNRRNISRLPYMPDSILVVGGAGYIGSHMVKRLRQAGFAVAVADDLSSGRREAVLGADLHVGDIGDPAFVDAVLCTVKPTAVMHFASFIQVGESVAEPAKYYRNNVTATQVLLDAMRAHGITRFIFSSTAAIFGEPQVRADRRGASEGTDQSLRPQQVDGRADAGGLRPRLRAEVDLPALLQRRRRRSRRPDWASATSRKPTCFR